MDHAVETIRERVSSKTNGIAGTFIARRAADGSIEIRVTSIAGEQIIGPAVRLLPPVESPPLAPAA